MIGFFYEFNGYWKDVGTLTSYWESNMELIDIVPEFNLYEEFWKIYTKSDVIPPGIFLKMPLLNAALSVKELRFMARYTIQ